MEAIPINVIGKGGASCIVGEPCIYLNQHPLVQEFPFLLVLTVAGVALVLAALAIKRSHPIEWLKEKSFMWSS